MKADTFEHERQYLFGIAYRMLGSRAEADDVLQDAWLRVANDERIVDSPRAFLTTVVSRLCLDALKSARVRRESYIGPWLPEPILGAAPDAQTELAESLSLAFLVLLERLSPLERAAFLLREVFDVPYAEVATTLDSSEAACRQLVARARAHVDEGRTRFTAPTEKKTALLHAFVAACGSGDEAALASLLAEDVHLASDGGGKVHAARKPIFGRDHVVRFLLGIIKKNDGPFRVEDTLVNGQPGIVFHHGAARRNVVTLSAAGNFITDIWLVANPDKLG